ncbi:alpha-2-macroglobulin [Parvularcula marina]|uniref:alpha-2-macroglobulin family protein n=1 Tax=Parvularcula marina TaxID=2292771 RepID=UPI00351826A3
MSMTHRVWRTAMAALLGLSLLACSNEEDAANTDTGTEAEMAAEAPRPAPVPEEFAFLRYAVNGESTTPELCLTFSEPLSPDTDYSAYVDIDARIALRVDGARLCLGGLSYGDEKELTLRAGFPSADGDTLERDESLTLTFDDRPAVVAFAGSGVILPRIDADGLALTTVNVDEVEIKVSRVTDRALVFRTISEGYSAGEGEYGYGGDEPYELGTQVWKGRIDTAGPTNSTVTSVFPIAEAVGELEPGAYYVEIKDAGALDRDVNRPAEAARWVLVTDLAFTAYRGKDGLNVTVRSLQSAEPISGVEVQLVARSNEILGTKKTNGSGQVDFSAAMMAGDEGNTPSMLMAYGREGDFALLDLNRTPVDLSNEPVSGRYRPDMADAFLYLDRGIYRPGETVQASLLLRDAAGHAVEDRAGALVLYQPNGIEQARVRFEELANAGGLSQPFALPKAAARGIWRIAVELDGAGTVGSTSFSVEDFIPQRIALELEADTETPMRSGETRMIEASTRFLYGAPGAGLPVRGTARVETAYNPFKDWAGYSFGMHDERFSQIQFDLPETTADGEGKAAVPLAIAARGLDSTKPLRVRAVVEVEEPGGRVVADDVRIPYHPRDVYLGMKPGFDGRAERGKEASFEVIAVDAEGAATDAEIGWRLVRRDYDYDWYRTSGGSWRWRRSERIVPIESGVLNITGEGEPALINTPELDWGDYTLFATMNGEDLASKGFWVGWRGRTVDGVEAPDQVRVSAPENPVTVGERATLTIKAPYAGLAEVVVATDEVLLTRQVSVEEAGAEIALPVSEDWGSGAYVMVTVYTPRDAVTQPRPRRAVGVAYVPVDVSDRSYEVMINAPGPVKPNQTYNVDIVAQDGPRGKAYVTLAAVDEGILLLTKFDSPQPLDWFFGKSALGVNLYDDYGRLLDPNQGAASPIRSGGDQIGGAGLTVVPTKTVALFSGVVEMGRDGRATVPLKLPDFNGELRLMAVVWSDQGIGSADLPLTVRDDVPAELILPRFLAPGDEALATVTADNVAGPEGEYDISVVSSGEVSVPDGDLKLTLNAGDRKDENVRIKADEVGLADLAITAKGPGGYIVSSSYPIEVRPAFWPVTRVEKFTLAPGESYTPPADLLSGFISGTELAQISAAATPIDTAALYASLYRYAYACTEQLVSRTMPLLYAEQLAGLEGVAGPDGVRPEIREAIETLLSRQNAQGAFGLWRIGDQNARPWIGAYAADFLTRAKEQGYAVPEAAVTRALDALTPLARGQFYRSSGYDVTLPPQQYTADTSDRLQNRSTAYALYVLARNGRAERSRLRYMHDEMLEKIESPLARAHIAAGLAAIGDRARAANAFEKAVEKIGYQNDGDWYQTPRRDLAAITALAAEAGYTDIVEKLVPRLARDVPEPRSLTTQEKAQMIMAARAIAGDTAKVRVSYHNEEAPQPLELNPAGLENAGPFTNEGDSPVWVTVLATGSPSSPPPAQSADLTIDKRFTDLYGEEIDLGAVERSDRMVVWLTLTPERRAYASYIIADLLPAGFEIETVIRPEDAAPNGPYTFLGTVALPNVAEARDDRFVAAIDTQGLISRRLAYIVRAVTPGEFTMPGAVAEDMYRPDVTGRSASGTVSIAP